MENHHHLNGKQLKQSKIYDLKGEKEFDCSDLPEGIYLYSLIIDGKEISTKKMVISR